MSNETRADRNVSGDAAATMAAGFKEREFAPDELSQIKQTRRRSPRIRGTGRGAHVPCSPG